MSAASVPVDKGTALHDSSILVRAPHDKVVYSVELQNDHTPLRRMNRGHPVVRLIEAGHTSVPGVHISTVDIWESERLRKDVMK